MIKLKHEKHGIHVCYSPADVESLEANGWEVITSAPETVVEAEVVLPRKESAMTKRQLIAALREQGIEFDPSARKSDLHKLYND